MSKIFKTAKGTELPLMSLKGKDYLEVKWRLVWFREEKPSWGIETEFVVITEDSSTAKAIIKDESGRIIATSHKTENSQGFGDFLEKSETGAIGRALALIGYGTQFADELDEGERIVDSPVAPKSNGRSPQYSEDKSGRKVTDNQLARLFAIQKARGVPDDVCRGFVTAMGVTSSKNLTWGQYDKVVSQIEGWTPPVTADETPFSEEEIKF